jgi:hypothetical protein
LELNFKNIICLKSKKYIKFNIKFFGVYNGLIVEVLKIAIAPKNIIIFKTPITLVKTSHWAGARRWWEEAASWYGPETVHNVENV